MDRSWIGDVALIASLVALAAIVFTATAGLPVPAWEPMGPAALPRALAAALVALSGVLAIQLLIRRTPEHAPPATPEHPIRYGRTVAAFAVIALAVAVLHLGWLGYRPVSFVATVACGFILSGFDRRRLLPLVALGLILSLGLHFIFTQILVTSLI